MQLQFTFSALLAGLLIVLSAQDAEAKPVKRSVGMITLPLTRAEHARRGIHPSIFQQQLINRADRRLARMTGREAPPDSELVARLERRISSLNDNLTKRLYLDSVAQSLRRKKGKAAGGGAAGAGSAGASGTAAGSGSAAPSDDAITDSNTPTFNNSLALDIEGQDVSYLATVQIGTPPQDFIILMDSGSADFWVGSENCQTIQEPASQLSRRQQGCGNHQFLGTQSSSSFQDTQQNFQVTYGTGAVTGDIVQDNVVLAGLPLNNHTFGVATGETVDFTGSPFDGLMGLAQSTLSEQKTLTPPESLAQAGLIDQAIVSFKIPRLADNKKDGEITFGGLDSSKFDSSTLVQLDNVNSQGFWEVNMDAVAVDGQDAGLQGRTAILDSGTTLIIAPNDDATAVVNLIPGSQQDSQNGFTVPCDTNTSVALTFGGTQFAIDPRDIAAQPLSGNTCLCGIQAGNIGGATEWLVGDVFLKNAYFSTNVQQNTISLAKLV